VCGPTSRYARRTLRMRMLAPPMDRHRQGQTIKRSVELEY